MGDPSSENVCLGIDFADLIFVVCQSTAKIGSLEDFLLYGTYLKRPIITTSTMVSIYIMHNCKATYACLRYVIFTRSNSLYLLHSNSKSL